MSDVDHPFCDVFRVFLSDIVIIGKYYHVRILQIFVVGLFPLSSTHRVGRGRKLQVAQSLHIFLAFDYEHNFFAPDGFYYFRQAIDGGFYARQIVNPATLAIGAPLMKALTYLILLTHYLIQKLAMLVRIVIGDGFQQVAGMLLIPILSYFSRRDTITHNKCLLSVLSVKYFSNFEGPATTGLFCFNTLTPFL